MESKLVEFGGSRLHCLVAGEGRAVVLLPGLLDWAARWAECGYVDSLARDFQVLAIDPFGVGESDRPIQPDLYTYAGIIEQVVAVLDALSVTRAHIWGYSAGGQLAAALAQRRPGRVQSLVVGGQVPIFRQPEVAQFEDQALALLANGWDGYWNLVGGSAPDVLSAFRLTVEPHNDPVALAARLRGMAVPFEGGLPFRGPKLCYVGGREPWLEQARQGMGRLGARFEVIPDADHGAAFRNRERVEPIVRDFLAGVATVH